MRLLAIGDIHGCFSALDALLEAVGIRPDDQFITLGDYVDRGPDSCAVLERLIRFYRTGQLIAIRGNHDWMMQTAREDERGLRMWLQCGGDATLLSYGPFDSSKPFARVPSSHWYFLDECCLDWYEDDRHFFVHANAHFDIDLSEQPLFMLLWEKLSAEWSVPHKSGKVMVCGHTAQRSGRPLNLGHAICVDTCCYGGGWLTCVDVLSGEIWQANNDGELRTGSINDPLEE